MIWLKISSDCGIERWQLTESGGGVSKTLYLFCITTRHTCIRGILHNTHIYHHKTTTTIKYSQQMNSLAYERVTVWAESRREERCEVRDTCAYVGVCVCVRLCRQIASIKTKLSLLLLLNTPTHYQQIQVAMAVTHLTVCQSIAKAKGLKEEEELEEVHT